jgi:anti-sigma factor RsiW
VTCREFAEFIVDYLEGALAGDVREPFEHHLAQCPNCERYLAQYRTTVDAGRSAFADPEAPVPSSDVPEGLIQAILASRRK